ncbi:N-acetyl-1-D-myo-inositol-2-amino-2-deoxy-alpha-D-glucopyranoside deacetylase [Mycolicibacterium aichiense]|uniref:N-acetyl-1-D-myo-inositol-2-amino-2-deoxy-alpha- D-glucopyranoside deacetylase n=1 Tax=Mycolicibacterium aichiense TaxID=1799 RepID=UPI003D666EB8
MAEQETPRLLFVHAHPDDETMNNAVSIARYVQRGAEVTVVTCTLGEEGEIIDDRWRRLAVDEADQLGGYRIGELTTALQALGLSGPRFLGGAGKWRDSGMPGTPVRKHTKFVDADVDEAVGLLADVIDELRPHVVATYDPGGGYGHPDHVQTHKITTAAVAAATWTVPKFYWGVICASAFRDGVNALTPDDVLADWIMPPPDVEFGFPDDRITAIVEAPEHLDAKVDAIAAHATQMLVGPTRRAFTLSNKLVLPVLAAEHYVLVEGAAGPTNERGWETDLLGGLGFGQ